MKKKDQKSKRRFTAILSHLFLFYPCFWANLIRVLFLCETDDALLFAFRSLFGEANDVRSCNARVILRV